MSRFDFDLKALYDAIDARRQERQMTWTAVAQEINRFNTTLRPIALSTIKGLQHKPVGEGDGVLQMLFWLGRSPESFGRDGISANRDPFLLPKLSHGQILRWDTQSLYRALNAQRQKKQLTWLQVSSEIGGWTPSMLTNLAKGGRAGFPRVMRVVRWLDQPAASFTKIARCDRK